MLQSGNEFPRPAGWLSLIDRDQKRSTLQRRSPHGTRPERLHARGYFLRRRSCPNYAEVTLLCTPRWNPHQLSVYSHAQRHLCTHDVRCQTTLQPAPSQSGYTIGTSENRDRYDICSLARTDTRSQQSLRTSGGRPHAGMHGIVWSMVRLGECLTG